MDGAGRMRHASRVTDRAANDVRVEDPYVERAIAAMRAEPARRWTVAALARVAGLSRAPFARRFQRSTRTTPLQWLTEHRLGLAREELIHGERKLASIANAIGYGSEFAFSKAFKRVFGVAPTVYRRRIATGETSLTRASASVERFRFRAAA